MILADVAAKAIEQLKSSVREILKGKMSNPLTYEEVKELGLPVTTDMPHDVYKFMELFPQPKQRIPSVQYVPIPARQRRRD